MFILLKPGSCDLPSRSARWTPIPIPAGTRRARSAIVTRRTISSAVAIKVRLPLLFSGLAPFFSQAQPCVTIGSCPTDRR